MRFKFPHTFVAARRGQPLCMALGLFAAAAAAQAAGPGEAASFPLLEPPSAAAPYRFDSEANLAAYPQWNDLEADTLRQAELTRGAFAGTGGIKIHYRLYRHRAERRGGVVLVSGRTEGLVMYQELIRDLVSNGYSVYIHDHRGQGFSQRLLPADPTMGYVDEFENYVKDLAAFVAGPVREARKASAKPLYLLAHSMGGTVSALYLEEMPASGITAAALVTPMLEPWAAASPQAGVASKVADAMCDHYGITLASLGWLLSDRYAEGSGFDEEYAAVRSMPPGAPNDLTHSALRFARHWQARAEARCAGPDCGSPDAKVGGVSYRWFDESCYASSKARGEEASRIAIPVLLLQGGQDVVVKPSAQADFCRRVNQTKGQGYCVGRTVAGARHSLFIEVDGLRAAALGRVLGFFDCTGSAAARCD